MNKPIKVFCSHRSLDKPEVVPVAEKLRAAGIDAWLDQWEIDAGDSIIRKIEMALNTYDIALVFLSQTALESNWVRAEVETITHQLIQENKPVIPVIIDRDVIVPAFLKPYAYVDIHNVQGLIHAIQNRGKPKAPPLGTACTTAPVRTFRIELKNRQDSLITVAAYMDNERICPERQCRLGVDFHFSLHDFKHPHITSPRMSPAGSSTADRTRELHVLGRAVGAVVFHQDIARKLMECLDEHVARGGCLKLCFATDDPEVLSIPFEAAQLPDNRIPALETGVQVTRLHTEATCSPVEPQAGPLRILAAVGAPDEGKTLGSVLNLELELQTILNAVQDAREFGNADVKILETGHWDEIEKALLESPYHILHISGHGGEGIIEMEDEDGNPAIMTADDLTRAVHRSGRRVPLVVLAACHSGSGTADMSGFAQSLLIRGFPQVLSMQTSVSDGYATQLVGELYKQLSITEIPCTGHALAQARQKVEETRRKMVQRGESGADVMPEYATASLFLAASERPLMDRSLPGLKQVQPKRHIAAGDVPLLKIGELIGRRVPVRKIMKTLNNDKKAGFLIHGMGGVGKSAIAGRIMERMLERNWVVVTVSQAWNLSELCQHIGSQLMNVSDNALRELCKNLVKENLEEPVKIRAITTLLHNHRILLVLDNFEDNLETGGSAFKDPVTAGILNILYRSASKGKILITSRYPAPGSESWLDSLHLEPLSPAQTRKFFLLLKGLKDQNPEDQITIRQIIGGHPRMLEYMDAILRQGKDCTGRVVEHLKKRSREAGIDWKVEPAGGVRDILNAAIDIGVQDILMDELFLVMKTGDRLEDLLYQASVFAIPVPALGLTFCRQGLKFPDEDAVREIRARVERLVDLSLLTPCGDDAVWVHRWTADHLKRRMGDERYRELSRRAGEYRAWNVKNNSRSLSEYIEAMRRFLDAQVYDRAVEVFTSISDYMKQYGRTSDVKQLAAELVSVLPKTHDQFTYAYSIEADALLMLGYTNEAVGRYEKIIQIEENRAKLSPDRADYQRDLSVSYERMADLMKALGQGEGAKAFYQKALDIRLRLAKEEPDRADYQRDLSVSYNNMADLMKALGQGEGAKAFYQKALDIRLRLAKEEPDRADYQRDLSVSYNNMADLMYALGQGEGAKAFYQKALDIAERLAKKEPDRADYQRDLSVSYNKMADLMKALGQGEGAKAFYQKALDIRLRLAKEEPTGPIISAISPFHIIKWRISCTHWDRAKGQRLSIKRRWT